MLSELWVTAAALGAASMGMLALSYLVSEMLSPVVSDDDTAELRAAISAVARALRLSK
jgi:hypothetical protein